MAGPTAGILLPSPLTDAQRALIRSDIQHTASDVDGGDFRLDGRPFGLILGPEHDGELEEFEEHGVSDIIGWLPQDMVWFAAMCTTEQDHRLLAGLCLRFVGRLEGVVDFGGPLLPSIHGDIKRLWHEHYMGAGNDWADWEPHVQAMLQDLPGHLYTVPYPWKNGFRWAYHLCDGDFLAAWTRHEFFHMIK